MENSTSKMAKKTIFFDDKFLVLRLKKGVQFAWAKNTMNPRRVIGVGGRLYLGFAAASVCVEVRFSAAGLTSSIPATAMKEETLAGMLLAAYM